MPLADRLAARYRKRGVERDDLVQVARLALVKAADRFDATRGSPFPAFASLTINGEIKRHFRDQGWSVKPPRSVQEAYLNVRGAQERLCQQLGRQATTDELSEHTGLRPERVQTGLAAHEAYRARGLDVPASDDGSARSMDPPAREEGYERVEDRLQLSRLMRVLSDRDTTILRLRFWEELSQSEIADQVGVSQVQVSRRLRSITKTLRERQKTA